MAARMEVSESAGGGDDREVVFNDQDSEKLCSVLLAITDKLDQLQKSARAKKALLQASGVDEPAPTSRPLPNFSRLPRSALSHGPRPVFRSMDTPAAREDMAKVAATMLETKTSFETLSRALTLAQSAEAIGEGLDPNSTDAAVQLNQEEVEHLKGLLAEQKELSLSILDVENQRLSAQLELQESMEKRARAFSFEGENMDKLFNKEVERREPKKVGGDKKEEDLVEKKRSMLKREEAKLNQMKFMLQKLLFLLPPGDADSEVEKRQREMMVKCGRTIQELQAAHL